MKLKVLILGTGLALFGLASCGGGEEHTSTEGETTTTTEEPKEEMAKVASYAVNSDASSIVWHGDALAGAYAHAGTIKISGGSLQLNLLLLRLMELL